MGTRSSRAWFSQLFGTAELVAEANVCWSDLLPIPGILGELSMIRTYITILNSRLISAALYKLKIGGLIANRTQIPFAGSTFATSFISPKLVDLQGIEPYEHYTGGLQPPPSP